MQSLFRKEAIDAQREKLLGEVSLARPVPLWVFTLIAVAFAAAVVTFAFLGEYTRRERVEGFLAMDAGAARILAPAAGTVAQLQVKEGDEVGVGAPIAQLSFERTSVSGTTEADAVQRGLGERLERIQSEITQARLLSAQEAGRIRLRISELQKELDQAGVEFKLQEQRVDLARQEVEKQRGLVKEGFASDATLLSRNNELLDQQGRLETLRRNAAAIQRDLRAAQAELPTVETKTRAEEDRLLRARSDIKQTVMQEEVRRGQQVRAPIAGTVTNIAVALGDSVAADTPMAVVVPKGSGLRAQLLVPTRAIGFIRPGNRVVLRYEAFPFQRFGQYHGEVANVGQAVWSGGDKIGPLMAREPVYRVDVKLDSQAVAIAGQQLALRPGMLLGADILLEKRTVFEWVFEPVLEWRGRL